MSDGATVRWDRCQVDGREVKLQAFLSRFAVLSCTGHVLRGPWADHSSAVAFADNQPSRVDERGVHWAPEVVRCAPYWYVPGYGRVPEPAQ